MPRVGPERDDYRDQSAPLPIDRQIAALAARQYGVVTARQLAGLGVHKRSISYRVAAGRLHRVHRGVYAVGHTLLGCHGHWMAAVLACAPEGVLSHGGAGALWEIRASAATSIDVSVPRTGAREHRGLRVHRPRTLARDEVTAHRGIPVTTPARTLLDLAAILQPRRLERALDQAEILELTDYPALAAIASAHPGHRGAGRLKQALHRHTAGTTLTRSELEERLLALCTEHGLPQPGVNEPVASLTPDFLFRAAHLAIETDSWQFHRTRQAFERDRRRDATLTRAGYRTLRFTHRQIAREPDAVAETIAAALR